MILLEELSKRIEEYRKEMINDPLEIEIDILVSCVTARGKLSNCSMIKSKNRRRIKDERF